MHGSMRDLVRRILGASLLCAVATAAWAEEEAVQAEEPAKGRALPTRLLTVTGDLDVLLERRAIRMLVPYSPTLFFHDRGHARGMTAQAAAELEKYLNKKYPGDALHRGRWSRRPATSC